MPDVPSDSLHTVVITSVKDEAARARVAHVLSEVTKDASEEHIRDRMSKLPWTISRRATPKKAMRLVQLLERLGAKVSVTPPLQEEVKLEMGETQLIPGTDLLSGTQMVPVPESVRVPSEVVDKEPRLSKQGVETPAAQEPFLTPAGEDAFETGPLSLGGILDRSFQICSAHFWKLLAIVVIPWLINVMVIVGLVLVLGFAGFTAKEFGRSATDVLILVGGLLVPSAVVFIVAMFYLSQGALIQAVSSVYLGRRIVVREAYRFVLGKLGRYFLTSCLFILAVVGFVAAPVAIGAALFFLFRELTSSGWWSAFAWLPLSIVPVYGTIKLLLFDKVVIIEDIAYFKALGRSWSLLTGKAEGAWPRGYFLRLFILLHLFVLLYLTVVLLFQAPASIVELFMTDMAFAGTILGQVLSNAGSLIASVFNSVCMVVLYYDIRNRKEGFDLKMLSRITRRPESPQ